MFASSGEATEPCGVPISVSFHLPSSITPACNHFWISRRMRRSATRCWTNFRSQSCDKLSKKAPDVTVQNPVHLLPCDRDVECVQRLMLAASWSEPIRETPKILFVNL